VTLKLALLPILDALPIFVAQEQGYFDEQNLLIEFIPVGSAAERDQVMASGQADGMINDLVSTLLYNKDSIQIQIVSFARIATTEFPQYRILASGASGITDIEGLHGVEIGISEASVIEYTTDRLLEAEGFSPEEIQKIAVPRIDLRMSMLDSGELMAANLPDPAASLAIQGGAVLILDDTSHPEYGNSVISFRKAKIDENPEAVRGFLAALERAIAEINADPTQWDDLLTEQNLVPAPLIGSYQIPPFPTSSLPSESQWADVLEWAQGKGLVDGDLAYQESVTDQYLP
jgi:NitT/TauT family transport system substrate-binding protein